MPLRSFVAVGLNHRTASVEKRECFALDVETLPGALQELRDNGAEQVVILSTCNRTEVYAVAPDGLPVRDFFVRRQGVLDLDMSRVLYMKHGREAARQLFRVASGLDSQVLGENEIMNQVKRSWSIARAEECTGAFLDTAFQRALVAGKRVRTSTELGRQPVSIASLAIRLALQEHPDFERATVLIVGTGEMGRRIVKELEDRPPKRLYVMSHTLAYAEELAREGCGEPVGISQLEHVLPEADVVFTVTAAPHPILDRDSLAPILATRGDQRLMVFDLGVPRNTEPEVGQLPNVALYDIEDLKALSEAHRKAREREIPLAEKIIDEEIQEFVQWCKQRSVVPMISALRTSAESIRQHQLSWALSKMGALSEAQRATLEQLTERLVKQMLHYPISELRNSAGEEEALAIISRAMGLDFERLATAHPGGSEPN